MTPYHNRFLLRPAAREEAGLFYSDDQADRALGTVGHVRMDFGSSGKGFYHTWWPHNRNRFNTPEFKEILQQFVDTLRQDGPLKDLQEATASTPSGVVTIPQTDEPLRLQEGDQVLCDDGTVYEITDLRLWEEPEPLPVLARDWPELELPKAEVRRFQSEYGDNLHIRNLYETRRMEYTIYNAAMNCPELWKDGVPTLNLHLGISAQNAVQMFWPWQEDQLTQVFCSAPGARFEVEAWDVYHNGKYLYTEYNIRGT